MLYRIRLELTVLAAVAIAITALVFAVSDNSSQTVVANLEEGQDSEQASTSKVLPKGALEVDIVDFRYSPDPVRVAVGTTVVWSNLDTAAHTVTADDRSWGSKYLAKEDVFVTTFEEPGVYNYFCELHPPRQASFPGAAIGENLVLGGGGVGMQGTIIVE